MKSTKTRTHTQTRSRTQKRGIREDRLEGKGVREERKNKNVQILQESVPAAQVVPAIPEGTSGPFKKKHNTRNKTLL